MTARREYDYSDTGFAPIDEEHRTVSRLLLGVVEAVNRGSKDEVAYALDAAIDAVIAHFGHEERLMEEAEFSHRARHKIAHEGFLVDTRRHRAALGEHGVTPDFRRWANGRLREWFRFHVMANDVELGKFLRVRQAHAPVAMHL